MSDDDIVICRCEEITKKEIVAAIEAGADTIAAIRRMTRAGMGLCQGRTCRTLIMRIIAETKQKKVDAILPATFRGPVRPMKIESLCSAEGKNC